MFSHLNGHFLHRFCALLSLLLGAFATRQKRERNQGAERFYDCHFGGNSDFDFHVVLTSGLVPGKQLSYDWAEKSSLDQLHVKHLL